MKKESALRIKYVQLMQKALRKDESLLECHVRVFEQAVAIDSYQPKAPPFIKSTRSA